jgi:hypothetical protein
LFRFVHGLRIQESALRVQRHFSHQEACNGTKYGIKQQGGNYETYATLHRSKYAVAVARVPQCSET